MLFLFNQTGDTLKLQCDIVTVDNHEEGKSSHKELTIWAVTPNGARIGLLETTNPDIIAAAKTRFKLGVMDIAPGRLVGQDFYIPKKLTGYDITNHGSNVMVSMIPCTTNPSTDRDTIRNLALGIFKVADDVKVNLRTYDTNDTSMTKIDRVSVTNEKGETDVYEFRFVAIKWSKWFRLNRPSLLLLKNGDLTEVYKFSAVKSKLRAEVMNDWLEKLTTEEANDLLAKAKASEPSKIDHVQEPRKMQQKKPQGNRKPFNGNRRPQGNNGNRPHNGGGKKYNSNSNGRPKTYSGNNNRGGNKPYSNNNKKSSYKKKTY